jgi:hypothetical protein
MPLSDDPSARVLFYLSTDLHKPKETRPAFVCKVYTRRQSREKREKIAALAKCATREEALDKYIDIIMEGVVDWRNFTKDGQPIPFSREALNDPDLLTDNELRELGRDFDSFDEVDAKSF